MIIEQITREDVYNVITPVAVCLLSGVIPLITSIASRFTKGWKYTSKKSDFDSYVKYFLIIMVIAIPCLFLWSIFYEIINTLLKSVVDFEISIKIAQKIFSAICIIIYLCLLITIGRNKGNIRIIRFKKFEKIIRKILVYCPFVIGVWVWGVSTFIESSLISGIMILCTIICEILAFCVIDSNKKYPYTSVKLMFADGSETTCDIDKVKQKGNWIIAEDVQNCCETRYRKEDLVKACYFNETTQSNAGEEQNNTEEES